MKYPRIKITALLSLAATLLLANSQAATPYTMSSGNYLENFGDIANWANDFASGAGASCWGSVAVNASGTIPDGAKTTKATTNFTTTTTGGVQKGTGTIILLSTGTTDNSSSCAIDLYLDFTSRTAGTLSFDWQEVNNSTGDRASSLRIYTSTDGATWTELTAAAVLNVSNNVAASGSVTAVALPSLFDGSATAWIRFYEYNGTGGSTGSRAKIAIDNVAVTATGGGDVAPTISSEPQSRTNNAGSTAIFSVAASGSPAPSYLWKKNGGGITDPNASGITSATLTITNVLATNAGNYQVFITNTAGSTNSQIVTLTVIDPVVTGQTGSRTKLTGQTMIFQAFARGTAPLAYQWYKDNNPLSDTGNISGSASDVLTINNLVPGNAGSYFFAVTNSFGAATSSFPATLTLIAAPSASLALWNFNDTNQPATSPPPATGSGTAALVGGTTATYASGCSSDDGDTNQAWNTSSYPVNGAPNNKSAGVQFNVSTVNKTNIFVAWWQRHSATASKYTRLQYTTNGTDFTDADVFSMPTDNSWQVYTSDLSLKAGVSDNPNFGVRIVAEWESTAIGSANEVYVGTTGGYSTNGTIRFDLVNVLANPLGPVVAPAQIPLSIRRIGGNTVLSWTNPVFKLESASSVATVHSNYTEVVGATSPYTNALPGSVKFFQLHWRSP